VRIAVSSSTFRRPLAAAELTQLEWLERCASVLGADGILAGVEDFPRRDAEYVAQLRKVAIDLGLVPFGIDAAGLFEPGAAGAREEALALASGLGAAVIRTALPAPGPVPPATFAETTATAKAFGRAAKAANVTVLVAAEEFTLGADLADVMHLLKDADSAWLRACPSALIDEVGPKDRYPAFIAKPGDDPVAVAARACRSWVILDGGGDQPWDLIGDALVALRTAEAERRVFAVE
jgi:hypothetical protein